MPERCEACSRPADMTCGGLDEPMLNFCATHYIEHLESAHGVSVAHSDTDE